MKNMKEEDFYNLLDIADELGDLTNGYYPTVAEMEEKHIRDDINTYLITIAYFASDPFSRIGREPEDMEEYMETVKYCKKLLYDYAPT